MLTRRKITIDPKLAFEVGGRVDSFRYEWRQNPLKDRVKVQQMLVLGLREAWEGFA